jgi:hypothetical protein
MAILLEVSAEGVEAVARDLRSSKDLLPGSILLYRREAGGDGDVLANATDADLVAFVDKQR